MELLFSLLRPEGEIVGNYFEDARWKDINEATLRDTGRRQTKEKTVCNGTLGISLTRAQDRGQWFVDEQAKGSLSHHQRIKRRKRI